MNWQTLLKSQGYLVADGAMGTQLIRRGLPPGTPPEAWNLENPDTVADVARAYVEAGARIVLTNTFGATRWKLCLLYTSPSPRDRTRSRMPSSA